MSEPSAAERALLALYLAPGIGPKTLAALLDRFGDPEAVVQASAEEISEIPYVGAKTAAALRRTWERGEVDAELARMREHGVAFFCKGGPGYPERLTPLAGSPSVLYVKGELVDADRHAIALVGSRGCTTYGRRMAQRIAYDLAKAGYTIVSGLARGIDAEAHRGALEAGGRTLAVLANGLGRVYPPEHAELANEVSASGALLSEACMMMDPMAGMFPARNRIITGLSLAVVVVEAGEKSGALISALHAAEQGRDVFVVPGAADSASSAGSLELLRGGARLVRNAKDVLEDLEGIAPRSQNEGVGAGMSPPRANAERPKAERPAPRLDGPAAQVWEQLAESASVDVLCRRTGLPIAALSAVLTSLEMDGFVRKLPGNAYERA